MPAAVRAALVLLSILATLALAAPAAGQPPKPFTVAVFPDTQNFSANHPDIYEAMCRWIADNREVHNIVFVSHVGDIVNNDRPEQWANARRAHDILSEADIPYGLAIGNHDGENMYRHELTGKSYLAHFGPDTLYDLDAPEKGTFADQPWWGGHSASGLSNYQLLDPEITGAVPMIFVHLEVGLRQEEVDWARDVIAAHPGRVAVLSTHRYLYDWRILRGRYDDFEYDQFDPKYLGQDVTATELFEKSLAPLPNALMVWCGHCDGEFRQQSKNNFGMPVFEHLMDFQSFSPNGGDGWFRLYTFDPAQGEIRVNTYSPTVGRYRVMTDVVTGMLDAFHSSRDEADRRAGIDLQAIDDQAKALIVGAFSSPGAMSRFIQSMKTGAGDFAWVFPAVDQFAGEEASRVKELLKGFPWDNLSPGLVRVLDRDGAPVIKAVLEGDTEALRSLMTDNDNALLIEAFLSDGDRAPSFTMKVDFDAYYQED